MWEATSVLIYFAYASVCINVLCTKHYYEARNLMVKYGKYIQDVLSACVLFTSGPKCIRNTLCFQNHSEIWLYHNFPVPLEHRRSCLNVGGGGGFLLSPQETKLYECCYGSNDVGETTCSSVEDLDAANRYKIQRKCLRSTPVELILCSLVCHSL